MEKWSTNQQAFFFQLYLLHFNDYNLNVNKSLAMTAQTRFPSLSCCLCLQGFMFGYATDETEECMPLTILLAHKLNYRMKELSRNGECPWILPDSKSQVRHKMSGDLKSLQRVALVDCMESRRGHYSTPFPCRLTFYSSYNLDSYCQQPFIRGGRLWTSLHAFFPHFIEHKCLNRNL